MDTLPNVNPRRGGQENSYAGLTSNVYPEVQNPQVENSHTGVTSNFVPMENHHWFVFRVLYGHDNEVVEALKAASVQLYIPLHYDKVEIKGKERLRKVPLLPGLLFAYMTREKTCEFVKQPARTARFLKYYTDKTKPIESDTLHNPPIIVSDSVMDRFIDASSIKNEHSMMLPNERCRFKKDQLVKVIKGDFKGVVGKVVRAAGQQRVGIEIEGVGIFVTAYIPSDFMIIYNDENP